MIKKYTETITKNTEKLKTEMDYKEKEKLRLKIEMDLLRIKLEKLN